MNYQTLLNTATDIGAALLANGAETYRVEDSVTHVLNSYDLKAHSVFAVPSYIIVSITTHDGESMTNANRVLDRAQNIDRIIQLNSLCRYITTNKPSLSYITEQLDSINESKRYPAWSEWLANCLVAFSFALFFGGTLLDGLCGALIGALVKLSTDSMKRFKMNGFTCTMINSFIISVVAVLLTRYSFGQNYDRIIIGCFMLLVPGVALTNAARDFIAGDLLSGTLRMSEAMLVAISIALGSGIALYIFR